MVIGGIVTAIGVSTERYRWEWLGCWLLAFGVATYAALSWDAALDSARHGVRALMLSALTSFLLARAFLLGRIDRQARLRKEAENPAGGAS